MNRHQLVLTNDNSYTVKDLQLDETFHSLSGAINESLYVYIEQGLKMFRHCKHVRIFEMGFGTGINALLTYVNRPKHQTIYYESIDLFPLSKDFYPMLISMVELSEKEIYQKILEAEWDKATYISETFVMKKIVADMRIYPFQDSFDLVYYDAFSPKTQPELWTTDIFSKIFKSLTNHAVLVTYASSGMVKSNLTEAGFHLERLQGHPPKKHMIRAIKK